MALSNEYRNLWKNNFIDLLTSAESPIPEKVDDSEEIKFFHDYNNLNDVCHDCSLTIKEEYICPDCGSFQSIPLKMTTHVAIIKWYEDPNNQYEDRPFNFTNLFRYMHRYEINISEYNIEQNMVERASIILKKLLEELNENSETRITLCQKNISLFTSFLILFKELLTMESRREIIGDILEGFGKPRRGNKWIWLTVNRFAKDFS